MSLQTVALQSNAALLEPAAPISDSGLAESSGAPLATDNPLPLTEAEFWAEIQARLPSFQRYARSLTRSANDAEDLVQDTLERLCVKREQYQRGSKFSAWAMTVMKNIFLDHRRRRQRWTVEVDVEAVVDARCFATPAQEDRIVVREACAALAKLPASQRDVLMLNVFDGLSYEVIGARLGIPVGTVRSRLFRARTALAKALSLVDPALLQRRGEGAGGSMNLLRGIHGRRRSDWPAAEERKLEALAREGLTTPQIAARLGRTLASVRGHMHDHGIRLRELRAAART